MFGVSGEISAVDARQFDSLVDAQPYCPTVTGFVPTYSPLLHQIIDQDCFEYELAASFAIALCHYGSDTLVSQGSIDQPLQPIASIPALVNPHLWQNPRISPEGDILYLDDLDLNTLTSAYRSFTHQPDGSWAPGPDLPFTTYGFATVPSRGPERHLLFYAASAQIEEWAQDATGTWSSIRAFDFAAQLRGVWFSPDGLRAVLSAQSTPGDTFTMLLDRARIDDPFGTPLTIPTLPSASDVFVTADCTRAYMSGARSVFYALQI